MPPTPEQWRLYREEIARSRAALPYWREHAPDCYSPTTEARVAVADHLTACEGLLREVNHEYYLRDCYRDQIAALLGSDAAVTDG